MRNLIVLCLTGLVLIGCGVKGELEAPPASQQEEGRR